ncbi:MAG: NAD(P)/FAD-dependent oxidoreductase [Bacteroidales bacterium]|nr:NAD(P)/FAD-dependent oxidoreductase [Bacteroidales bacterium]
MSESQLEIDVIIIGAGPAGLFAASHITTGKVLILEKKKLPGRKLMIAGSGRCNLTHTGHISEFLGHYGDHSKFLRQALYAFTNLSLIDFFESRCLSTITDKNGKVFPSTERSADVLEVLLKECRKRKVTIQLDEAVTAIRKKADYFEVETAQQSYLCRYLLISTGGLSYPGTGCTGDGYDFARKLGHSIVTPKPALSPVIIKSYKFAEMAGVSLSSRPVSIYRGGKKIRERNGDIGFTHKGLTGPGILDFSRFMMNDDVLKINLINIQEQLLRDSIIKSAETAGKTLIQTFLKQFDIPRSLVKLVLLDQSIDEDTQLSELRKEQRNKLVSALCEYPFEIERIGGFKMAMVTTGGVNIAEISSQTMESKVCANLFFAGEVLDIDGDTGGYNLQASFSTAFTASETISRNMKKTGVPPGFRN